MRSLRFLIDDLRTAADALRDGLVEGPYPTPALLRHAAEELDRLDGVESWRQRAESDLMRETASARQAWAEINDMRDRYGALLHLAERFIPEDNRAEYEERRRAYLDGSVPAP